MGYFLFALKQIFGGDLTAFIKSVASGQASVGFNNIFAYVGAVLGLNIRQLIPVISLIVVIAMLTGLVSAIRGNFASSSVQSVVHFATVAMVSIVVLSQAVSLISETSALIGSLKEQMEVVFPLLFTFMSALGANGSTAVYQPAVATLSFSITELLSVIVLPMLIVSVVTSVVGGLSQNGKLSKTTKFFESTAKGVMYSAFFIFVAFLSVQGITAGVYDNLKVRTAKFALSKYVPVIGGYLAEGFNLVLAGTVLIKNAVGLTAVIILLITVLPLIIKIVITTLALKLVCALTEPFSTVCNAVGSIANTLNILIAVVLGVAFCYFVFLLLLVSSGNLVL